MNRKVMSKAVRNGFRRFVCGTRGRVTMEYAVLGVYVAALTVVAAMVIGLVFSERINTISVIAVGNTKEGVRGETTFKEDLYFYHGTAADYQKDVIGNSSLKEMPKGTALDVHYTLEDSGKGWE